MQTLKLAGRSAQTLASSSNAIMVKLTTLFDRVVVINLARRPDRLDAFHARLADWPFAQPQRFDAVDGALIDVPGHWEHGPGAWACRASHLQVLQSAITDGVTSLLVLEDDAYPAPHFKHKVQTFFDVLPRPWDGVMLGAQHLLPPAPVITGVVRCTLANRMHAYALRDEAIAELATLLERNESDHCDVVMASMMSDRYFFAPQNPLVGQAAGVSDITGKNETLRFMNISPRAAIGSKDRAQLLEKLITRLSPLDTFKLGGTSFPCIRRA